MLSPLSLLLIILSNPFFFGLNFLGLVLYFVAVSLVIMYNKTIPNGYLVVKICNFS